MYYIILYCIYICIRIYIGVVDGTLLALAGLKRLSMHELINQSQVLTHEDFLPAVSQGAIGIQCRRDDSRILNYLTGLNHKDTQLAVECERAFLTALEGNCRTPIAAQAKILSNNKEIEFRGIISKPDGTDLISIHKIGSIDDNIKIGYEAAEEIKNKCGPEKYKEYQVSFNTAQLKS